MVRDDDGAVRYFAERDVAGTYYASVPATEPSLIVRTANGYERRYTDGRRDSFTGTGHLVERADASGRTVHLARDHAGRLVTATDPDGRKLSFTYGADG